MNHNKILDLDSNNELMKPSKKNMASHKGRQNFQFGSPALELFLACIYLFVSQKKNANDNFTLNI